MTSQYELDFAIFIGRMRPLHLAHEFIINEALKRAERLIILIGSANRPRSFKVSAFDATEVLVMLELLYKHEMSIGRIIVRNLDDYIYDEAGWIRNTQTVVDNAIRDVLKYEGYSKDSTKRYRVGLAGFGKDSSSFYLERFPDWDSIQVGKQFALLSATDIRNSYFQRCPQLSDFSLNPKIIEYLRGFMHTDEFVYVVKEREAIEKNIRDYGIGPFHAGDVILTWRDKVLLVTRKGRVGFGLLAFPGGMHNYGETLRACAHRELNEESGIFDHNPGFEKEMPQHFRGYNVFDSPTRDPRGQYISHAYHYDLPYDFDAMSLVIEAKDDAQAVGWKNIPEWGHKTAFLEHFAMLRTFIPALDIAA